MKSFRSSSHYASRRGTNRQGRAPGAVDDQHCGIRRKAAVAVPVSIGDVGCWFPFASSEKSTGIRHNCSRSVRIRWPTAFLIPVACLPLVPERKGRISYGVSEGASRKQLAISTEPPATTGPQNHLPPEGIHQEILGQNVERHGHSDANGLVTVVLKSRVPHRRSAVAFHITLQACRARGR